MNAKTISPPNAIVFVLDPTNKDVAVPSYINGELTAATDTCVSVATQAPEDGDTKISLELGNESHADFFEVFCGCLASPSGKVAIVTSHFEKILELDVPSGRVDLRILVDDLRNPAQIAACVTYRSDCIHEP